ncbi:site-specific DNA-methyltransferase [Desulfuromonas acetoxidans]|uniref:site-specific DNA-methyltransferase n=1 Tax=Desulfuromonas acetoxidans TaxID=891 RepID=UPI00292EB4AB|nr:site-specific DNA-methyltransferase [Desulfuromonas acetoxidans]
MIKRCEHIGLATLYLGDCMEFAEVLCGDALITDPPYGINLGKMSGKDRSKYASEGWAKQANRPDDYYVIHGDDKPFDPSPLLRYPKVVLWGGNHFASRLPDSRSWIVWDKREETGSDNQADCELAWTNLPGPVRMHHQLWRGICRRGEENVSRQGRVHPTQKPVRLMEFCIAQCRLDPDAVIDDWFMGSGTTGVAAVRHGFRFVGVEIDAHHFDTACQRIEDEQRQLKLAL